VTDRVDRQAALSGRCCRTGLLAYGTADGLVWCKLLLNICSMPRLVAILLEEHPSLLGCGNIHFQAWVASMSVTVHQPLAAATVLGSLCCHSVSMTVLSGRRDTAGQGRFRSLTPSYIRDSSVAVVVYDVTSE